MDPVAVPYAVSKELVDHARIRHDWGAMHIALKGDDKEYYVDIKVTYMWFTFHFSHMKLYWHPSHFKILSQEFEMLFEDLGGFDGLYLKMLACGIPTAVHLMWIPLSELNIREQFLLIMRLSYRCLNGFWKTSNVSHGREWLLKKIRDLNDDIMMMIIFPLVELIIPFPVFNKHMIQ